MSVSCDAVPSHQGFAEHMGGISFPMASDFHPKGQISELYGVYNPERGTSRRSTFIIDREGIIRYKKVYESGLPDNEELLVELAKLGR
ncbi:MAG: putative alkyl hydroperoxide reductase [Dehalococcoidia bacterium]|nr:putative alkyl hydroperoxide reductase [Dehalococcoidia bacterium]